MVSYFAKNDKLYVMSKSTLASSTLPAIATKSLEMLGRDLALGRQRRKESLKSWSLRMNISVPTLMRMEKGDPNVRMGVYATALWLMGRHLALGELATPKEDSAALELDIRQATQRHASRKSSNSGVDGHE